MDSGKIRLFILTCLVGCLASCVKDPQDIPSSGVESNPVFSLHGSFNNHPISIDAGIDGWTLLPVVKANDSIDIYSSIFSVDGCLEQCNPSWSFHFFQALPEGANAAQSFQNTIHEGEKEFVLSDAELDSFEVSLSTHPGLFMSGYSFWSDLNDPVTTFEHEFHTVIGHDEDINVCFQSQAFTGCQYTQCIYFDPSTQVPCLASIEPILENSRYVSLNLKLEGTPPFQIRWFNEETTSSIVIPLQDSTSEIYAGVSVIDGLGNRSELHQTIRIQGGYIDACYFPIVLTSTPIENTSAAAYQDRVEIIYRDSDGVEWSSSAGLQPQESIILINEVTPYAELSPMGLTTYITEVGVTCLLFNSIGESRVFTTQEMVLALGHQ